MMLYYRIHGDNIVECERIAKLIEREVCPTIIARHLISPSTISIEMDFQYNDIQYHWIIDLLPGFNKSGRRRWTGNIFNSLKENGSFLDETPDAIITSVNGNNEHILCAIEFCSALQAGNQAWQRSGRAYSTGRTGCPYLYIVDFVKYELDPNTRVRKALRFPNAAVPYSYINYSENSGNFVAQVYVKSEEFDRDQDRALSLFNEDNFGENELKTFIVKIMLNLDTSAEKEALLQKNMNMVVFLSNGVDPNKGFTSVQWENLHQSNKSVVDYCIKEAPFNFHKTITKKGHHGKSPEFLKLIDTCSVGLTSKDLPIGIIPAINRARFANGLKGLYPSFDNNVIDKIGTNNGNDLILCLVKGFKPRGDDNRPDRGILPMATMLSDNNVEIMTYIYGPIISNNYDLLVNSPQSLASNNGFWKSILALSDYLVLDVPILKGPLCDCELLINNSDLKQHYLTERTRTSLTSPWFSGIPQEYHEDDVDTGIHFLFTTLLDTYCFEGMCNPPGGDWSGFSIKHNCFEKRWLSLPRVSETVNGKRPDHVIELFGVFEKPLLLTIESKENSADLENSVGLGLKNYIQYLMEYVPNVQKQDGTEEWCKASALVDYSDFETISGAAYLKNTAQMNVTVFGNSNCDMLFIMSPINQGWDIEIIANTTKATTLKNFLLQKLSILPNSQIVLH